MIYNGFPVALLIKIFHQEKPKQNMSVFWDVDGLVSSPNGVCLKIMCPIQWIWNLKVTRFRAEKNIMEYIPLPCQKSRFMVLCNDPNMTGFMGTIAHWGAPATIFRRLLDTWRSLWCGYLSPGGQFGPQRENRNLSPLYPLVN
jgi:hypothetical protein